MLRLAMLGFALSDRRQRRSVALHKITALKLRTTIMTQHSLIIATGNAHKVEEFELLLKGLEFEVVSAKACGGMPDVDENGSTFAANAQIKAEGTAQAGACRCLGDGGRLRS